MSYSISISGHKNVDSPEEGHIFEEQIAEEAKKFVSTLEGCTYANLSGSQINVNLLEESSDG